METSSKLHVPNAISYGLELLIGDTPEETRDTRMCRDTMVENPWLNM